ICPVDFAPVHFIGKFHAGEFGADFRAREFFESVLRNRTDLVSNEGVNCESDESCELFHYRLSIRSRRHLHSLLLLTVLDADVVFALAGALRMGLQALSLVIAAVLAATV